MPGISAPEPVGVGAEVIVGRPVPEPSIVDVPFKPVGRPVPLIMPLETPVPVLRGMVVEMKVGETVPLPAAEVELVSSGVPMVDVLVWPGTVPTGVGVMVGSIVEDVVAARPSQSP